MSASNPDKSKQQAQDELSEERTLLAAERTFSAWIRTGLAAMGGGLAIVRLIDFNSIPHQVAARIVGALLILWAGALFLYGFWSYHRTASTLEQQGLTKHSRMQMLAATLVLVLIAIVVLWIAITSAAPRPGG